MRTPEEMGNLLSGLGGGYVPAGPSGLSDARAGERAPDGAQLLLRGPEGSA